MLEVRDDVNRENGVRMSLGHVSSLVCADLYPQRNMVNVIHKRSFKEILIFMSRNGDLYATEGAWCYGATGDPTDEVRWYRLLLVFFFFSFLFSFFFFFFF